jgi:hypothetical protein
LVTGSVSAVRWRLGDTYSAGFFVEQLRLALSSGPFTWGCKRIHFLKCSSVFFRLWVDEGSPKTQQSQMLYTSVRTL